MSSVTWWEDFEEKVHTFHSNYDYSSKNAWQKKAYPCQASYALHFEWRGETNKLNLYKVHLYKYTKISIYEVLFYISSIYETFFTKFVYWA